MQFASNLQAIPTNFDRIVQYSSKYCIIVQFHHASKVGVFLVWHKPPQIWNGSWPSSTGLRGHRRTYLTILERAWSANFKMVWHVRLRPLRPELNGQDPFQICGGLCQTRKTPTLAYCTITCTLAMQPCPAALPTSLAEKFASCFTAVCRHACMHAVLHTFTRPAV
jgi:hypothetical protein